MLIRNLLGGIGANVGGEAVEVLGANVPPGNVIHGKGVVT